MSATDSQPQGFSFAGTKKGSSPAEDAKPPKTIPVERVQTGIRIEKRMLKVLKAMAEYLDMTLTELVESIILHAFEGGGADAFGPKSHEQISQLKKIYGLDYDTHASYRFIDQNLPEEETAEEGKPVHS